MRVLFVDPSLFTAPYDAHLTKGMLAVGIDARWATRPLRAKEEMELPLEYVEMFFYRLSERSWRIQSVLWRYAKGLEHAWDLHRLAKVARTFDVIHIQFAVLPKLDLLLIRQLSKTKPVVLTVHDTTPFNGTKVNRHQCRGLLEVFSAVDHLVVLTAHARETLVARGLPGSRISVIEHGPLTLRSTGVRCYKQRTRWRIVFFGRIQAYKGIDILLKAIAMLPPIVRMSMEVIVAGEPFVEKHRLVSQAKALGLEDCLVLRLYRLPEEELANLLASADTFVFPYLQIDASGAFFLALGYQKWIIASKVGAFQGVLDAKRDQGVLVPPGDVASLSTALEQCIGRKVESMSEGLPTWEDIGEKTASLYKTLLESRKS